MNNKHKLLNGDLYETIAGLNSADDVRAFMLDLCTPGELAAFDQRLSAAKMLLGGSTYEQVISATDISSATLSRVSKCVKNGSGYRNALGKTPG